MTREFCCRKLDFNLDKDQGLIFYCSPDQAWTKLEELEKDCDYKASHLRDTDFNGHYILDEIRNIAKRTREFLSTLTHQQSSPCLDNEKEVHSPPLETKIIELDKKLPTDSELVSRFSNENATLLDENSNLSHEIKNLSSQIQNLNLTNSKLNEFKELATSWEGKYNQSVIRIQNLRNAFNEKLDLIDTLRKDKMEARFKRMDLTTELDKERIEKVRVVNNTILLRKQFEELQAYIFQMTVSNEIENCVLSEKLESAKHEFENKANTHVQILQQKQIEYGELWERFCILQKQVLIKKSSLTENHVTKTSFDQKVIFINTS